MTVQEIVDKVNSGKYPSLWNVMDDLNLNYVGPYTVYKNGTIQTFTENHRWYSVEGDIYAAEDGLVAIIGVEKLYSEKMSYKDCEFYCKAFEVFRTEVLSYVYMKKSF